MTIQNLRAPRKARRYIILYNFIDRITLYAIYYIAYRKLKQNHVIVEYRLPAPYIKKLTKVRKLFHKQRRC